MASWSRFIVIFVALVAAMGGFIFGFDSGIIATTLGHGSFRVYFFGPSGRNTSLSGAIVSLSNAGQAIGGVSCGYLADKLSRKYTIFLMSFLSIVGAALQAGAVHVAMMILGRFIAGIACGAMLSVVPVYIAEVAPPARRGWTVGLNGMTIAIGFTAANWVGYAGAFAQSDAQWRIPLAMQMPIPALLMVGIYFVPFSPRWLIRQDRLEEAKEVLIRLHGDPTFAAQEFIQIREQLALENSFNETSWASAMGQLFSRRYIHRTAMAAFVVSMSQLSGAAVIQNFQSIFYETVGFTGRQALLISGVYGMMGVVGQVVYLLFVADKWPRVRTLWTGSVLLSIMIAVCMALSAVYGSSSGGNQDGARAAIAMIFIYSATFSIFFNAMAWVVASELFPYFLRSKGASLAVTAKSVVAIVLSQITPVALANISWRFYALFIATNLAAGVVYFFFLPETSGKSLEEIAELFGDVLATDGVKTIDVEAKSRLQEETIGDAAHKERV
ncbi:hypothetical protein PspLS_10271 [Pyricularia sp. CBS 133598]|nr:hypothetical protein PspLS_10271 [Pyricularia sp. CBS 133598]